jgi:hypothetical protein
LEREIKKLMSDADDAVIIHFTYGNGGVPIVGSAGQGRSGGTPGVRGHD